MHAHRGFIVALYHSISAVPTEVTTTLLTENKEGQSKFQPLEGELNDEDDVYQRHGKVCIPSNSETLKSNTTVEAHCEEKGLIAFVATLDTLKGVYWRSAIKESIRECTQSCIHCIVFKRNERALRPLSTTLHGIRQTMSSI